MNKRPLKLFYFEWLQQLRNRQPKLRGKRLKYNLLMQKALERDLNL